ncbi:hypothetical protein HDU76_007383 [Blyttiomyces sp. JEL0837]|nr:hypothetical protein HDU76_007383 [Blyttiomyces sp. JEL0837]
MTFLSACVVIQPKGFEPYSLEGEFNSDSFITVRKYGTTRDELVKAAQPFDKDGFGRLIVHGILKVNLEKSKFEVAMSKDYNPMRTTGQAWAVAVRNGLEFKGRAPQKDYHNFTGRILAYSTKSGSKSRPITLNVQVYGLSDETITNTKLEIGKQTHLQISLQHCLIKNAEDLDPTAFLSGIFLGFAYKEKEEKTASTTPKDKFANKKEFLIDLGDEDTNKNMEAKKDKDDDINQEISMHIDEQPIASTSYNSGYKPVQIDMKDKGKEMSMDVKGKAKAVSMDVKGMFIIVYLLI